MSKVSMYLEDIGQIQVTPVDVNADDTWRATVHRSAKHTDFCLNLKRDGSGDFLTFIISRKHIEELAEFIDSECNAQDYLSNEQEEPDF